MPKLIAAFPQHSESTVNIPLRAAFGDNPSHEELPTIPQALRYHEGRHEAGFTFLEPDGSENYYSFHRVAEEAERRGRLLRDQGLKKGDRVGFILPEGEEFVLFFLGALKAGIVPVPMYPPLGFGKLDSYAEAAARILRSAGAKLILTSKKVQPVLWSLVDKVDSLQGLVCVDSLTGDPSGPPLDPDVIDRDDPAFLQFTSGSTAEPKGVIVTHGSLVANMRQIMWHALDVNDEDVCVTWLPLYHDMGLIGFMLCPAWYGVPVYFISTLNFVKHPKVWLETITKYGGSLTFAPNFAYALAVRRTRPSQVEKYDLGRIRVMGCGAEPNHPDTLRTFVDHFGPAGLKPEAMLPCYGMAEATLAISFCDRTDPLRIDVIDGERYHNEGRAIPLTNGKNGRGSLEFVSCGTTIPAHTVTIVDESGRALPDRYVGEVILSGPSVAAGYFDDEVKTAETFSPNGLRTGDLGYLVEGELFVTGRKKDVVILNGKNYDPQSIEWVAAEVEGVRKGNVVAFSRPTPRSEELVVVAETRSDDPEAVAEAVKKRVRHELFLNVADVRLVGPGALPKTTSGKLQRRKTRRLYLEGRLGVEGVRTMGERGAKVVLARHIARSMVSRLRFELKNRMPAFLVAMFTDRTPERRSRAWRQ